MTDPTAASWATPVGALPTSALPRPGDLVVAQWLDLIHARQDVLAERLATIVRRLADLPDDLAGSLIAETRREISEGLAKALIAGRQGACSLCRGDGCESPSCRG